MRNFLYGRNLGLNHNSLPALPMKYFTEEQEAVVNHLGFFSILHLMRSNTLEQKEYYSDVPIQNLRICRTSQKPFIRCLEPYGKQTTECGSLRTVPTSKCDTWIETIPLIDTSDTNIHGSDSTNWNHGPFKRPTTNSKVTCDPQKGSQPEWSALAIREVSDTTGLNLGSLIQPHLLRSSKINTEAQDVSSLQNSPTISFLRMLIQLMPTDYAIRVLNGWLKRGLTEIGTLLQEVCSMIFREPKRTLLSRLTFQNHGELTDPSIGVQHAHFRFNGGLNLTEKLCRTVTTIREVLYSTLQSGTGATANRMKGSE